MGIEDNYDKLANRTLCGWLRPERPCKFRYRQLGFVSWLGLVKENKSTDYKYVPRINKEERLFINNSRRIASPVPGFSSGKCHVVPIMLCVIGAALPLLVRFMCCSF
jgi:hypothetical protein